MMITIRLCVPDLQQYGDVFVFSDEFSKFIENVLNETGYESSVRIY